MEKKSISYDFFVTPFSQEIYEIFQVKQTQKIMHYLLLMKLSRDYILVIKSKLEKMYFTIES